MDTWATSRASWLSAARRPDVAPALEAIFAEAAGAIAARGPACWASGRCCNFDAAGHRLYTTGLEAAYTVVRAPGVSLPVQPPAQQDEGRWRGGSLSLAQIGSARARGGCPFQAGNLCGVHPIKPVACRVYFCDRTAQAWQHDLAERLHERVRHLHERFQIDYRYAEWRELLEILARPGT